MSLFDDDNEPLLGGLDEDDCPFDAPTLDDATADTVLAPVLATPSVALAPRPPSEAVTLGKAVHDAILRFPSPDQGPLHWSDVKWLAKSAKHYRAQLATRVAPTKSMRRGTIIHRAILGGPPLEIFDGKSRRGKAWDEFAATCKDPREAVLVSEIDEAVPYIEAVRNDPVAQEYLHGAETEVPLQWSVGSRRCETRGVDILQRAVRHGDLKSVQSCRPEELKWIIKRMAYHAQVQWYDAGLRSEGFTFTHPPFLLCVEGPPAYDVVVVELSAKDLQEGAKMIHSWFERLDQAESSGEWTGYATAPVHLDLTDGLGDDDEEELEDEDDEHGEAA